MSVIRKVYGEMFDKVNSRYRGGVAVDVVTKKEMDSDAKRDR